MDKLADAIKIILEKHLIPTILSLVLAALIYIGTPSNYWIVSKITEAGYFFFIAGILFLLIQLIIYLIKVLPQKVSEVKWHKESKNNNERKAMEDLWTMVDALNDRDRDILYVFIHNDNKPIKRQDSLLFSASILDNNQLVHHRSIVENGAYLHQYVLEESFFSLLKYSNTKYGRICHFADDAVQSVGRRSS